jgi:hypothetical protein
MQNKIQNYVTPLALPKGKGKGSHVNQKNKHEAYFATSISKGKTR